MKLGKETFKLTTVLFFLNMQSCSSGCDEVGVEWVDFPQNSVKNYLRYLLGMKHDTFVTENIVRKEHHLPLRVKY